MTTIIDRPDTAVEPELFRLGSIAAISMVAAPPLLITGTALLIGIYGGSAAKQLEAMAAHPGRAAAATDFAMAGTILATFGIAGIAAAVARKRPRLGRVGGALTIAGLFGPAFFLGQNFLGIKLAGLADRAGAVRAFDDAAKTPNVVNLCGPALIAGFIVLAVGAAKTGVLSRSRSWALGLTAIAPVGLISGVIPIMIAAWFGLAIALIPVGVRSLRSAPRSFSLIDG